jgi:hypothetical protein
MNELLLPCFVPPADAAGDRCRPVIVGARSPLGSRRPAGRDPRLGAGTRIGSPLFVAPTTPGGEPVRGLRIPPPRQLELICRPPDGPDADVWAGLPEATRDALLALLARLIAKGALDEPGQVAG